MKFLILIPKHHPVILLLIREAHRAVAHMGMNATAAKVREKYWIKQIWQSMSEVLKTYISRDKVHGKLYRTYVLLLLSGFRMHCGESFSRTANDYTGALLMKKVQRQAKMVYIILFTCPVT